MMNMMMMIRRTWLNGEHYFLRFRAPTSTTTASRTSRLLGLVDGSSTSKRQNSQQALASTRRATYPNSYFNSDTEASSSKFKSDGSSCSSSSSTTKTKKSTVQQNGMATLVASATATTTAAATTTTSTKTFLTTVQHQAPYRLIPLRSSLVESRGASVCYVGNYGGGLVQGDTMAMTAHVKSNAKLGLLTQGSNRIYQHNQPKSSSSERPSQQKTPPTQVTSDYVIDRYSCLVVAPDPITPFANSRFQQHQSIHLHQHAAGFCLVDWYSAGRISQGEIWQHEFLQSQTNIYVHNDDDIDNHDNNNKKQQKLPLLIDSVRFDPRHLMLLNSSEASPTLDDMLSSLWKCHAVATVYLYGHEMQSVIHKCQQLQHQLLHPYAKLRQQSQQVINDRLHDVTTISSTDGSPLSSDLTGLSSRVLCSVSEIPTPIAPSHRSPPSSLLDTDASNKLFVVRYAAESNEDLYRVLHYCLEPLSTQFGYEFYKDRIKSSQSSSISHAYTHHHTKTSSKLNANAAKATPTSSSSRQPSGMLLPNDLASSGASPSSTMLWSMLTMADSALPVGSFAHSNGLEVAAQLRLWDRITTDADTATNNRYSQQNAQNPWIAHYLSMVTQSTMELYTPYILAVHQQLKSMPVEEDVTLQFWNHLETQMHARLVGNPPSSRASLDQGRSLLRIWEEWKQTFNNPTEHTCQHSFLAPKSGHLANVYGLITWWHRLDAKTSCHLSGYCVARDVVSAAVRLNLVGPMASVQLLHQAQVAAQRGIDQGSHANIYTANSSCAPLLDVLQPCHDVLATRLFRT